MWVTVLNRVRASSMEKMMREFTWGCLGEKCVPGRANRQREGSGAELYLTCLWNSEACVAG